MNTSFLELAKAVIGNVKQSFSGWPAKPETFKSMCDYITTEMQRLDYRVHTTYEYTHGHLNLNVQLVPTIDKIEVRVTV